MSPINFFPIRFGKAAALALVALCLTSGGSAFADDIRAETKSGQAWASLRKAVRHGEVVEIELRFETDYAGYSGEIIYDDLPGADAARRTIFLTAGDAVFSLATENGEPAAPAELRLKFNYNPAKNPRVGSWVARFVAPPADVETVILTLPNLPPIGPFAISQ